MTNAAIPLSKVERAKGYSILMPCEVTPQVCRNWVMCTFYTRVGPGRMNWCLTHPCKSCKTEMEALLGPHSIIMSYLRREPGPQRTYTGSQEGDQVRAKSVTKCVPW